MDNGAGMFFVIIIFFFILIPASYQEPTYDDGTAAVSRSTHG